MTTTFFQADFVRGYRFWDETGTLANSLVGRFQTIDYRPDIRPPSLVAVVPSDPEDPLLELRANYLNAWLSLRPSLSWMVLRQEIERTIDYITRSIFVTQLSRIGLRVTLLWSGESIEQVIGIQRSRILRAQDWEYLGEVTGGEFIVNIRSDRLTVRMALAAVQNVRTVLTTKVPGQAQLLEQPAPVTAQPDYAVMLDIDMADDNPSDGTNVAPHLNRSIYFLEERVVPYISRLIAGEAL